MKYPILMADVLNSRQTESKKLMTSFKKIVSKLNETNRKNILSPLTITLGDEFQGVLNSMDNGVRLIFDFEELILKEKLNIKLRYVLHYGEIETKINRRAAYEMLGPGLTETRSLINDLKKEDLRFYISTNKKNHADYYLNKAFLLYQSIVDGWKEKDQKPVSEFLNYVDYKKVALRIKTDVSSAWRRKRSLKINEYLAVKEIILHLSAE